MWGRSDFPDLRLQIGLGNQGEGYAARSTALVITSERVVHRLGLDGDPAELGELVDRRLAAEAPVAAGLDAAEGHLRLVVDGRPVDVANARFDLLRHPQPAAEVAGEDRRRQAVFGVVGDLDRLLLAVDPDDGDHRPERLLLIDAHRRRDPVDDGRLHHRAVAGAAGEHSCALAGRVADQAGDAAHRLGADAGAEDDVIPRVARRQGRGARRQFLEELIGDPVVEDDLLRRHADLAGIGKGAEDAGIDRRVDIGVVEDDQRRLAAELEEHRLEVARGKRRDDPADARRAGEVDPLDPGMGDQRLDDLVGVLRGVGDQIDRALRQAGVAEGLDDQGMGARAILRGLEDDGVAAGERHGYRAHAEDDRRVPWRHRQDHADRLTDGHRRRARPVGRDDVAGDLGGHRRGFADHVGGQPDIEMRPMRRAAGLADHRRGEVLDSALEQVGRLEEQLAALDR